MDNNCDYLVYSKRRGEHCDDSHEKSRGCPLCADTPIQESAIECASSYNTGKCSLDDALCGSMVPYVDTVVSEHEWPTSERNLVQSTTVRYVKRGMVISLQGDIHMRDVPPNGTWLSEKTECLVCVSRLRLSGLVCVHIPELNRMVIEQKNDDGLLYLTNKWLLSKESLSEAIELFGPFACDALLAPVLHKILRSSWIEARKEQHKANNALKLGWAQEFYDFKCVPKNATGSAVFTYSRKCTQGSNGHCYEITSKILAKMRCCGYTPWSAVQAVRSCESDICGVKCEYCKHRFLASCAFLMECTAKESSLQRDWLVRNEAVIQLCRILYEIHKPTGCMTDLSAAWSETIMLHSIKFQQYKVTDALDEEALVVVFANDHIPVCSGTVSKTDAGEDAESLEPCPELLELVVRNARFAPKRQLVVYQPPKQEYFDNISTALDVMAEVSEAEEARAQDVESVTLALVSCFPRVAESALPDLTFNPPEIPERVLEIWPLFVNSTRACYQLYRALAIPASPSPVYVLELLARGWRRVGRETLKRFTPMSTGAIYEIEYSHYKQYILGPLNVLSELGLVSEREKALMTKVLHCGVLPCFAGQHDSVPDRLTSSTVALAFAACGLRVFGPSDDHAAKGGSSSVAVTAAGLLYFAAWYLLVYAGAVHVQPTLRERLLRTGTDADRHLCSAFEISPRNFMVTNYNGSEIAKALTLVFRDTLSGTAMLRVAQLYVSELLAQLPYVKKLKWIPGSVKSAIESRDIWFFEQHGDKSQLSQQHSPPFTYLGNIANGLHSSLTGTLTGGFARTIAHSLKGPEEEFDLWCDSLWALESERDDDLEIDAMLRAEISLDETKEVYDHITRFQTYRSSSPAHSIASSDTDSDSEDFAEDVESDAHSPEPQRIHRSVCKGLVVASDLTMGFDQQSSFLTLKTRESPLKMTSGTRAVLRNPCMTNIASTVCSKVKYCERGEKPDPACGHSSLIRALWVLMKSTGTEPRSSEDQAELAAREDGYSEEPATPEALAVMIHLAVKSFNANHNALSVCNDIKAMCKACHVENEFMPIAAIAGGMFGVNLALSVNEHRYYVTNDHYQDRWAPGCLWYTHGLWYVVSDQSALITVTHEPSSDKCHHSGTIAAYCRLNDLRVERTSNDNYCGFHTACVLLHKTLTAGKCDYDARRRLVEQTVKYLMVNKDTNEEVKVYLQDNTINTAIELNSLLMERARWLSVEELTFILKAHGKNSVVITEHSYPIYDQDCVYFLIKSNHFEPFLSL